MSSFGKYLNLVPFIFNAIQLAESLYSNKPKSGSDKKDFVMSAAQTVIGGIHSVSTGGQKGTWERIANPVSNIIDIGCSILFKD